jgi:hypothetical protein
MEILMKKNAKRRGTWLLPMMALMLLSGCGNGSKTENDGSSVPGDQRDSAESAPPPGQAEDGPSVAEMARRDLAERLGQPIEDVQILEARTVYWRSAALGCPDPEQSYAQVVTQGWFIRLAMGRSEYRYHASETGEPFTCNPRWVEPPLEAQNE